MSRADVAGAHAALEGLALGYEDAGQATRAAHIRRIQAMLESDIAERDAERGRSQSRRDRRSTCVRPVVGEGGGGEISLSHSEILLKTERESAAARERPLVAVDTGERYLSPSDAITAELVETAKLERVQDIPGAWKKFTGHNAGRWLHVAGAWQFWCVNEAKHERRERDRRRPGGPEDPGDPYNAPDAVQTRQRARDREHEALTRARAAPQQVAGAVGALLASLGPKPMTTTTEETQPKKVHGG